MCRMASFIYRYTAGGDVDLRLYDLTSHANTQAHFPEATEQAGWFEGHYTPDGGIQMRVPHRNTGNPHAVARLREMYPTFEAFIWRLFINGDLPMCADPQVTSVLRKHGIR